MRMAVSSRKAHKSQHRLARAMKNSLAQVSILRLKKWSDEVKSTQVSPNEPNLIMTYVYNLKTNTCFFTAVFN